MAYIRTPKIKITPRHSGRVRRKKAQITRDHFWLLCKQSQTRSQEKIVNDNLQESISTHKNIPTNDYNRQDRDSDVPTNDYDSRDSNISENDSSNEDSDNLFQSNNVDNSTTNNFFQKIVDEPASFDPFDGDYGPYFANFTEQMIFLWVTKHMICR